MKKLPPNASGLAQYEAAKSALRAKNLTPKEYEAEIKKLVKKFKI
jgi:hypothetical protein